MTSVVVVRGTITLQRVLSAEPPNETAAQSVARFAATSALTGREYGNVPQTDVVCAPEDIACWERLPSSPVDVRASGEPVLSFDAASAWLNVVTVFNGGTPNWRRPDGFAEESHFLLAEFTPPLAGVGYDTNGGQIVTVRRR